MIKIYPAKEVTACVECPRCDGDYYCQEIGKYFAKDFNAYQQIHPSCPLETKEQA
jgi:hypothetical protein